MIAAVVVIVVAVIAVVVVAVAIVVVIVVAVVVVVADDGALAVADTDAASTDNDDGCDDDYDDDHNDDDNMISMQVVGTPAYLDPRVLGGEAPSWRSDMYSFGVLMGEVFTGKQLTSRTCKQATSHLPQHQRLALAVLLATDPTPSPSPSSCPTASQLLASPLFAALPEMRDCCITLNRALLEDGLECSNSSGRHFITKEAFGHHVLAECSKDLDQIKQNEGNVFCPLRGHGCDSAAYTDLQVRR